MRFSLWQEPNESFWRIIIYGTSIDDIAKVRQWFHENCDKRTDYSVRRHGRDWTDQYVGKINTPELAMMFKLKWM